MSPDPANAPPSLRLTVYRSGRHLVARQILGFGIRLIGIGVLTRILEPSEYGVFTTATVVAGVMSTIAVLGLDGHLVRTLDGDRRTDDTAFTLLLGLSVVGAAVTALAAPVVGLLLGTAEATSVVQVVAVALPLLVLPTPARARLERSLDFRSLAVIELVADVMYPVVAVPAALAGWGVWAPMVGFLARNAWLFLAVHATARYVPRLAWDRDRVSAAVRYGSGFTAGRGFSLAADLINPVVVGGMLGPEGVGLVGMASRLIEQVGVVKQATVRLGRASLARVQADPARLAAAHAEGVLVQLVGAVPVYGALAFAAPWIIPAALGSTWEPMVRPLALLAAAAIVGAAFNLHVPTLEVLGSLGAAARVRALQFLTLLAAAAIAVPLLGPVGYGVARLARTAPFLDADRALRSHVRPARGPVVRWLTAALPLTASPWLTAPLRPLLLAPALLLFAMPVMRAELVTTLSAVAGRGQRRGAPRERSGVAYPEDRRPAGGPPATPGSTRSDRD